jgi:hypothetical protein
LNLELILFRKEFVIMTAKFVLLSEKEASDPNNIGYAYAKFIEDRWVDGSEFVDDMTVGFTKYLDNVVKDGKVYNIVKLYMDVDTSTKIYLCVESTIGCETKRFN